MHHNRSTQRRNIGRILLQSAQKSLVIVNPELELLRVTAVGFVEEDSEGEFIEAVLDRFYLETLLRAKRMLLRKTFGFLHRKESTM
jgi:hypothetical protein